MLTHVTSSNGEGEAYSFSIRKIEREVKKSVEWWRVLQVRCCQAYSGLPKLKMDVLSEQEVEAGPSYASNGGESGVGKKSFEGEVEADTHTTPTERGGQALVFESRRQNEESSKEVISLCIRLWTEALGMNELGFATMDRFFFLCCIVLVWRCVVDCGQ